MANDSPNSPIDALRAKIDSLDLELLKLLNQRARLATGQKFFGYSAELRPVNTIKEVFESVEKGRYVYGVVPVENTTEGIVSHTLDMFTQSRISISGEILLQITHDLLSQSNNPETINKRTMAIYVFH